MITHTARAVSCAPINRKSAPVLPVIETKDSKIPRRYNTHWSPANNKQRVFSNFPATKIKIVLPARWYQYMVIAKGICCWPIINFME